MCQRSLRSELSATQRAWVPAPTSLGDVLQQLMQRLRMVRGVRLIRAGRTLLVPLRDVKEKIPSPWESMCLIEEPRRTRVPEEAH